MKMQFDLNPDFERHLNRMADEYGEDFELLNGLHKSQLNFSDFVDGFIEKNVADASIDGNANAHHKDVRTMLNESSKPAHKLFSFQKIFYDMKKLYGLRTAKEWLTQEWTGGFYLHNAHTASYLPYCFAYDLTRLATEGLFFIESNYNNEPPKHLTTFLDDLIEYISFMANRSSGAVGIPNVLLWTTYFFKKDVDDGYYIKNPDYYIRQCFQKFIYRLNQPFIRVDQSAFVNVSIFDEEYYTALFGGVTFPDGSMAIDYMDMFMEHQKIFMEVVSQIRESNIFTFPVLTYALLFKDGVFVDEKFARWCSDHNCKWNDSNFFQSASTNTLSNCPVAGDTDVLYYVERMHEWTRGKIKDLYHNREGKPVTMLSNGEIIHVRINRFEKPVEYRIELMNGAVLETTADHLNLAYGKKYIPTSELTEEDYLPFGKGIYEGSGKLGFDAGYVVGAFLGDGSYNNTNQVTFSLSDAKADCREKVLRFAKEECGAWNTEHHCISCISGKQSCYNLVINSKMLRGLIEEFVDGNSALNKGINGKAYEQSVEFRKGILAGLYATDGGNNGRIYTASETLKDDLIALCATLGRVCRVDTDTRPGRLTDNPVYTVRVYSDDTLRTKQQGVYIKDRDFFWVKIKSIQRIDNPNKKVAYCAEVLDDHEPVFTLGNGIITHNCRLLSDTSKLDAFINSIGGTALSIGSVQVNCINLVRIAYESDCDEAKYLSILRERTSLCCKVLDTVRHIIKRNIEKGLLPNYCDGGVELAKQYCTVGILGLYEAVELFGYTARDKFGNVSYTDDGIRFATEIFRVLNEVKDNFIPTPKSETGKYSFNIESVPGERAAVILCQKDNLLYDRNEKFIYSNQWIPLSETCTINEKLRLSSILDEKCSGGAIAHINLEQNFPNTEVAWQMLNYIARQNVFYFAFNTRINECENHHGFVGSDVCPKCGKPVFDTYQRIVGFLEPRRTYSKDRKREYDSRRWYGAKDWYDYAEDRKDL